MPWGWPEGLFAPYLAWNYGSGFPKGKGCLKPAWEPILLARRPGPRVLPLGIDECRVPAPGGLASGGKRWPNHSGIYAQDEWTQNADELLERSEPHPAGRYPANCVHDGSAEVLGAFAAFGDHSCRDGSVNSRKGDRAGYMEGWTGTDPPTVYGDTGTAARFFYCAKSSKADRGEGNTHPTVKPLALMRWLVRLVCPPGGTVLDPFFGSGTTGVACLREGRSCGGVESDPAYAEIARRRLAAETDPGPLFAGTLAG